MIRRPFIFIVGAAICVASFVLTNVWLNKSADKVSAFANSAIFDEASLASAAAAAGLEKSPTVQGSVDEFRRLPDGKVRISGWILENTPEALRVGAPVIVMAFSDGKNILKMDSKGERGDVAGTLKISSDAAKNLAHAGSFSCDVGKTVVILAVARGALYNSLKIAPCP